jgi:predicted 3-demethylubiquinone-9 3-methyltransferase (glyoxalase superfamily)
VADHAACFNRSLSSRRRRSKARVEAMMTMKKIDVAAIEPARRS